MFEYIKLIVQTLTSPQLIILFVILMVLYKRPQILDRIASLDFWGVKVRMERLEKKVEETEDRVAIATEEDEKPTVERETEISTIQLSENESRVLKALSEGKFPLRARYGISKDTELNLPEVDNGLSSLKEKGLASEVQGKKGVRWVLTPSGKRLL
jgi:hypothetical protein